MRRKLVGTVLVFGMLVCLMGASSIDFGAGQPNPNPGGVVQKLEGKGTYNVDPNERFIQIQFAALDTVTNQTSSIAANNNNPNWDATLNLTKGNYDATGVLTTEDKVTRKRALFYTKTVNVNVK